LSSLHGADPGDAGRGAASGRANPAVCRRDGGGRRAGDGVRLPRVRLPRAGHHRRRAGRAADVRMSAPVSVAFDERQTRAAFTLYHPKGNIVTAEMIAALSQAIDGVVENPHLKLITIEGAGADFSFGASIPEHGPAEIGRVLPEAHKLIYALLDLPVATAALVRGRCLGGGFEIALACDFIFAERSAVFCLPEVTLGVFPPTASALLPPRVGVARATSAILTGKPLPASNWHAAGLLEAV